MTHIYLRVLEVSTGSFYLKEKDELRICATVLPAHERKAKYISAKNLRHVDSLWEFEAADPSQLMISLRKKDWIMSNPLIGVAVLNINLLELNKVSDMVLTAQSRKTLLDYAAIRMQVHIDTIGAPPFTAEEVTIQYIPPTEFPKVTP